MVKLSEKGTEWILIDRSFSSESYLPVASVQLLEEGAARDVFISEKQGH